MLQDDSVRDPLEQVVAASLRPALAAYGNAVLAARAAGLRSQDSELLVEHAQEAFYSNPRSRSLGEEARAALVRHASSLQREGSSHTRLLAAEDELLRSRVDVETAFTEASTDELLAWRARAAADRGAGNHKLVAVSLQDDTSPGHMVEDLFVAIAVSLLGIPPEEAVEMLKLVRHVGPQALLTGIGLDEAISIKDYLENFGVVCRIASAAPARPVGPKREAVPESVRHEVWRRDEGKCVDCGSRERLEFDHIIPVAKGGSNTARNIELRCEECNRGKADRI